MVEKRHKTKAELHERLRDMHAGRLRYNSATTEKPTKPWAKAKNFIQRTVSLELPNRDTLKNKLSEIQALVAALVIGGASLFASGIASENTGRIATGAASALGKLEWLRRLMSLSKDNLSELKTELNAAMINKTGTFVSFFVHIPQFTQGLMDIVNPNSKGGLGDTLGASSAMVAFLLMSLNSAILERRIQTIRDIRKVVKTNKKKDRVFSKMQSDILTRFLFGAENEQEASERFDFVKKLLSKKKFRFKEKDLKELINYTAMREIFKEQAKYCRSEAIASLKERDIKQFTACTKQAIGFSVSATVELLRSPTARTIIALGLMSKAGFYTAEAAPEIHEGFETNSTETMQSGFFMLSAGAAFSAAALMEAKETKVSDMFTKAAGAIRKSLQGAWKKTEEAGYWDWEHIKELGDLLSNPDHKKEETHTPSHNYNNTHASIAAISAFAFITSINQANAGLNNPDNNQPAYSRIPNSAYCDLKPASNRPASVLYHGS